MSDRFEVVVVETARAKDAALIGARLALEPGVALSIGRAPESALVIKIDMVARHHAAVTLEPDGRLRLNDHRSDNGTFVDGEWVRYERWLDVGERFSIAGVVVVEFRRA